MNDIYVAKANIGSGLFAGRDFAKSEKILHFSGDIISLPEVIVKGDTQTNPLQIEDNEYIDLEAPGVFGNHSCDPNAGVSNDKILISLRPIKSGEEIVFDYSTTVLEDNWTMNCLCGSPKYRSIIGDFTDLPSSLQSIYLNLGIVQGFIVRHYTETQSRKTPN
ncbi:MAG: SET domain-containing protein-lysine N-methyltransferase [Mariprofundales bacterium]